LGLLWCRGAGRAGSSVDATRRCVHRSARASSSPVRAAATGVCAPAKRPDEQLHSPYPSWASSWQAVCEAPAAGCVSSNTCRCTQLIWRGWWRVERGDGCRAPMYGL
jgi:hypothetical protein